MEIPLLASPDSQVPSFLFERQFSARVPHFPYHRAMTPQEVRDWESGHPSRTNAQATEFVADLLLDWHTNSEITNA